MTGSPYEPVPLMRFQCASCLSRKTGLAMVFKSITSVQDNWRKLDGANHMPEINKGVEFKDANKQLNRCLIMASPTFGHSSVFLTVGLLISLRRKKLFIAWV
jgi:hypothetical protein